MSRGRDGPSRLAELLGRGGGCMCGVAAPFLVGADDRAGGGDKAARRMRLERRAEVLDAAALGADTGQEEDRTRHQVAEALEEIRPRGAGHCADGGEAGV